MISIIVSSSLSNLAVISESTSTDMDKESLFKENFLSSPRNCSQKPLKKIEMSYAKNFSCMTNLSNVKPKRLEIWFNHVTYLGWH